MGVVMRVPTPIALLWACHPNIDSNFFEALATQTPRSAQRTLQHAFVDFADVAGHGLVAELVGEAFAAFFAEALSQLWIVC